MSNEKDHAAEVSRLEARVKELTTERHFVNAQYDSLRAQLEAAKAQLTAQPDGVREARILAVARYICTDLETQSHHAIAEATQFVDVRDWNRPPYSLTTPAGSTPPEGKVLDLSAKPHEIPLPSAEQWGAICEGVLCGQGAAEIEFTDTAAAYFKQAYDAIRDLRDSTPLQALAAPATAPRQVTHVCEACLWEADTSNYRGPGSEGPEHTCEEAPAPACKTCGDKGRYLPPAPYIGFAIPCPDCNPAGEGKL